MSYACTQIGLNSIPPRDRIDFIIPPFDLVFDAYQSVLYRIVSKKISEINNFESWITEIVKQSDFGKSVKILPFSEKRVSSC